MAKHEPKPAWRIEVPSNAEAIKYIRRQQQEGKITKGTADEAIRQVQKTVKGITFDDKGKAKRTAAKIKGAKVVEGAIVDGSFKEGVFSRILGAFLRSRGK